MELLCQTEFMIDAFILNGCIKRDKINMIFHIHNKNLDLVDRIYFNAFSDLNFIPII